MSQFLWSRDNSYRKAITTIDDVIRLSEQLTAQLTKIGTYRHPLAIRRGVNFMTAQNESKTIKAGAITYFLDIKQTRENKPYLVFTESRFKGEEQRHERRTIFVFQESAKELADAFSKMVKQLDR